MHRSVISLRGEAPAVGGGGAPGMCACACVCVVCVCGVCGVCLLCARREYGRVLNVAFIFNGFGPIF